LTGLPFGGLSEVLSWCVFDTRRAFSHHILTDGVTCVSIQIAITILSTAKGNYQPASFVFATFQNETGWPAGVAFILGLLQSTFGLTGFDAISHMIEEMPRPSINAPRTMVLAVFLGALSSWIFVMVLLFCLTDFDAVISSTSGPLLTIYYQATRSMAGATCLLLFNICSMAFATQGLMTIASRMTMAVARDRLFGRISEPFTRIHPVLKVPVWAIAFVSGWVVVFGLIFLGSSAALNAILSASVVLVQISYIITIALVLFRGNEVLEPAGYPVRTFTLGKFRPIINVCALIFAIVTSVFFVFPGALPVSGPTMNYVIVVVAIVTLMCAVTWIVDGRKHFTGPKNIVIFADVAPPGKVASGEHEMSEM
jgi:choline transport protein